MYLGLREDTGFSFTIQFPDALNRYREMLSDSLNLKVTEDMKEPMLCISDDRTGIKTSHPSESPLINNIFKYRVRGNVYFLRSPASHDINFKQAVFIKDIFHAIVFMIHNEIVPKGGIPIHSAFLSYRGNGILLVGGSGAGKTTIFKKTRPPWKGLSDDQAIIIKQKNQYRVHPYITMSECVGKSIPRPVDMNCSFPLKLVLFINQSEKDEVIQIDMAKAAFQFYTAVVHLIAFYYRAFDTDPFLKNFRIAIFNNVCDIIQSVPSYQLNATLNGDSWRQIQDILENHANIT